MAAPAKTTGTRPRSTSGSSRTRVVTGVSTAWVNAPGGPVAVLEGDPIPDGVEADEIARLDGLGVFGEHKRVAGARVLDEMVRAGLAQRRDEPALVEPVDDDEPDAPMAGLPPVIDPALAPVPGAPHDDED